MKTKSTEEMASEINFKKMCSMIEDFEIKQGGILSSDFVVFQIVTEEE